MVKKTKNNLNLQKKIIILLATIVFFVGLITIPFINKVYPNIYIANTYIGDLKREDALKKIGEVNKSEKITLKIKDQTKELETTNFIGNIDYTKTIDRAYLLTNTGNFFLDTLTKLKLIFKPVNLGMYVDFDDSKLEETLTIATSTFGEKPTLPSATINNGLVTVNNGKNGVEVDKEKIIKDIKRNIIFNKNETIEIYLKEVDVKLTDQQKNNYERVLQNLVNKQVELKIEYDTYLLNDKDLLSLIKISNDFNFEDSNKINENSLNFYDDKEIKEKIADIARKINRNPQDSVFIVDNGVVTEFTPSKDGITVDEDKLTFEIKKSLIQLINENETKNLSLSIPIIKTEPKIKNEDINNLGIKTLLGRGVSYFRGSIPNRIHNVNLAQSKFKGILVPPNEIFSFNQILGDVSAYTGYKAAYVIKDGKTVLGDGGGVCQVSTTLFRAVLSSGLPVVERKPHSYRVGYYEQGFAPGLDATVFYPTTDFKFKNDTGAYILIQPTIDLNNYTLVFEIYGTSDGRIATTTKPVITSSIAPAPDVYIDDPSIPTGQTRQIEHRAYGARVVFDYQVTRNGETINSQKFVSNYRPWQAVYLRGTGN